jgi:hypothetical protein
MKRNGLLISAAIVAGMIGATQVPVSAATTAIVTSANDSGPGSLRAALAGGATHVIIKPSVGTIAIQSPLVYAGSARLTVIGTGQTIDGNGIAGPLLDVTAGPSLHLFGLKFEDSGGLGIRVTVPPSRTGTVEVSLDAVTVRDTADHGVLVDDEAGSPASVQLRTIKSTVERGGKTNADQDGIRVNERGDGGITFRSVASMFAESGGDGVELDEGGPGDVKVEDVGSRFQANGPVVPDDLEDGIDVDEADAGSVIATFTGSRFIDNFDEGADLNETGDGGITARFLAVTGTGTVDGEAIALEEHDGGDVALVLWNVTTNANNNDGVEVEETEAGNVSIDATSFTTNGNGADGLHVEEFAEGDVAIRLIASTVTGNADDGIQAEQGAPGAGTLRLVSTNVSGNLEDQINLDGVSQV